MTFHSDYIFTFFVLQFFADVIFVNFSAFGLIDAVKLGDKLLK